MSETIQERWARKGLIPKPVAPTSTPSSAPAGGQVSDLTSFRERAWVQAKLDAKCAELSAMPPESGRNNALNAAAYSVGHYVPDYITYDDAYDHLYTAAIECGCPGAPKTIESGLAAGMEKPRKPVLTDDPGKDQSDPFATGLPKPPARHAAAVEEVDPAQVDEIEWEPPLDSRVQVPPFPTHILGPAEAAVLALSDELQTPADIVAMMLLTTISATIRGRYGIQITDTWTEPLNLYTLIVAGAGETKSPALSRVAAPLRRIEAELAAAAAPQVEAAEQALRIQEKRLKSAEDRAVKATGDERDMEMTQAANERRVLAEMGVPVRPRLLAGDMTAEGLVRLLAEQGGVLASLSAEGGLLDTLAGGRYSSGMANLDAVLQAHDGREPILVDRKGAEPLRVDRPCLTLGLAVQPQVLRSIGQNEAADGRGFLARFLYCVPVTRVGSRDMGPRRKSAVDPAEVFERVVRGVDRLCATSTEGASVDFVEGSYRGDFKLSSLSLNTFYDYRQSLEPRLHDQTGDLAGIQAWANKLIGQTARLAGILHCLYTLDASTTSTEATSVSDETVRNAITLANYLIGHSIAAHQMLRGGGVTGSSQATQLLGWARKNGLAQFTVREAHRALCGRIDFKQAADVIGAATDLLALGYLKPLRSEPTGGRPASPAYLVNPLEPEETA